MALLRRMPLGLPPRRADRAGARLQPARPVPYCRSRRRTSSPIANQRREAIQRADHERASAELRLWDTSPADATGPGLKLGQKEREDRRGMVGLHPGQEDVEAS